MSHEPNLAVRGLDALHIEEQGAGRPLVLLHGWGLHSGVWDEVAAELARRYRVLRVDLPGHGRSAPLPGDYTLAQLADTVRAALRPRLQEEAAVWVGWSLGGLVALQTTLTAPELAAALVLVACTPRFTATRNWPHAIAGEVLRGFAAELKHDYRATLLRFLALQARGGEHARDDVRRLRERLFACGGPDPAALRVGLAILEDTDLRERMHELALPTALIGGERDTLVPSGALYAIADVLPRSTLAIVAGAGHAPFVSHRDVFMTELLNFLDAAS